MSSQNAGGAGYTREAALTPIDPLEIINMDSSSFTRVADTSFPLRKSSGRNSAVLRSKQPVDKC
jgi:hypothetical protein